MFTLTRVRRWLSQRVQAPGSTPKGSWIGEDYAVVAGSDDDGVETLWTAIYISETKGCFFAKHLISTCHRCSAFFAWEILHQAVLIYILVWPIISASFSNNRISCCCYVGAVKALLVVEQTPSNAVVRIL